MFGILALVAMASLPQIDRDLDFDKPPMNTLHDCTATPEPYGDCKLPAALSAQDIQARLAGKRTAWWREGDQFVVVAKRDTDQAYLCCAARGRMDQVADGLWALRLRVVDLDRATIDVIVEPEEDSTIDVYRGPDAPKALPIANKLQGMVRIGEIKSKYLEAPRRIFVYTPPGFDPKKKYPVVYMADAQLRGDTPGFIDPLIVKGELPPMILVGLWYGVPTAGDDLRSKEYLLDWPGGEDQFISLEDFLLKEVMPYVEQTYGASTDPKQRVITGFSSGAAWAVAMGLLHPDVFPNVVAQSMVWSGPAASGGSMDVSMNGTIDAMDFTPTDETTDVFARYLPRSKMPRFYLSAGTLEPYFYRATLHFAEEARATGHEVQVEPIVSGHSRAGWPPVLVRGLKWALGLPIAPLH